ncbi:YoaK family protein [Beduini massiliensis]|uniref:YoaK family protein n=1 Tax=Beduini massiliensis TaxID=1585974 RepID=UPI00059AAE26|nr:YoaK family protein [Beduini massiliensis]
MKFLREQLSKQQVSESFVLASLLAFVGGYLDAYTYFCRGHVFANAQTGNIIFLGLNIGNGNYLKAASYLIPILAFILGVLLAQGVREHYQYKSDLNIHWRQIIVLFELLIIGIVAFVPTGKFDLMVNTAISFVCSLQAESFRKVNGNAYASTMCTGNLRSGSEQLYKAMLHHDQTAKKHAIQYFMIIALFIIGAVISMYLTRFLVEKSILVSVIILAVVFLIMFIESKND